MALCLANQQTVVHSSSTVNNQAAGAAGGGLVMKAEAVANGLVMVGSTGGTHSTNNVNQHHHLIDNPAMKLDNLDNWDQDV